MTKKLTKTLAFALTFILLSQITSAQSEKKILGEKRLPSVEITDMDGSKIDISTFGENEKITVFCFWATWCGPCKKELNNINQMYDAWVEDYDMELIAISIDDVRAKAKVKTYSDGQDWSFDVLLDMNQDLKRALNFQAPPFTVLISEEGNIVYTHTGYVEGDEYELEDKIAELKQ